MPEEQLQQFHSLMSERYGNFPDLEKFQTAMQDEDKRKKFHTAMAAKFRNFPEYEKFTKAMVIEPSLFEKFIDWIKPEPDPVKAAIRDQITNAFNDPDFGDEKAREISEAMAPVIKPIAEFSKGFIETGSAGLIGSLMARPEPEVLEDRNFVEKMFGAGGSFAGFIVGAPFKMGKVVAGKALASSGGKKMLNYVEKKIGKDAPKWLTEAMTLGTASAIGDSKRTFDVLKDPSVETITNDLISRAESFAFGAATGAQFGVVRDLIGKFAYRAAVNLALSNSIHIAVNRGEIPDTETIVFSSLLDVFFSKTGRQPSRQEIEIIKEHAKEVNEQVISAKGVDFTERARLIAEQLDKGEVTPREQFLEERRTEKVRSGVEQEVKKDMEGLRQQLRDRGFETESERLKKAEDIIADLEKIPEEMKDNIDKKLDDLKRTIYKEQTPQNLLKAAKIIHDIEGISKEIREQASGAKVTKRKRIGIGQKAIDAEVRNIEAERKKENLKALPEPELRDLAIHRLEARGELPPATPEAGFEAGKKKPTIQPVERETPEQLFVKILKPQPKPEEVKVSNAKQIKEDSKLAEDVPETTIKKNIRKIQSETQKAKSKGQRPIVAVKMEDGTILKDRNANSHADLATRQNIDPDKIADTGWFINGKYQSYYEQGKQRAAEKKANVELSPKSSIKSVKSKTDIEGFTGDYAQKNNLEMAVILKNGKVVHGKGFKAHIDLVSDYKGLSSSKAGDFILKNTKDTGLFDPKTGEYISTGSTPERFNKIKSSIGGRAPSKKKPKLGTKPARIKALRNLKTTEEAESFGKVTELKEADFHKEYARVQKEIQKVHDQRVELGDKNEEKRLDLIQQTADLGFRKQMIREALNAKTGKRFIELEGRLQERPFKEATKKVEIKEPAKKKEKSLEDIELEAEFGPEISEKELKKFKSDLKKNDPDRYVKEFLADEFNDERFAWEGTKKRFQEFENQWKKLNNNFDKAKTKGKKQSEVAKMEKLLDRIAGESYDIGVKESTLPETKPEKPSEKENVPEGKKEATFADIQSFEGIKGQEGFGMIRVKVGNSNVGFDPEKHFLSEAERNKLETAIAKFEGEALIEKDAIERLENPVQKSTESTEKVKDDLKDVVVKEKTKKLSEEVPTGKYKVGDTVDHPLGKVKILDTSDPDFVTVDSGTMEFKIKRSIFDAQVEIKKSGIGLSEETIDRIVFGSPEKEATRATLREKLAQQAKRVQQAIHRANVRRIMWDKTPLEKKIKFMQMIGEGKITTAEFENEFPGQGSFYETIAKEYRERLDEAHRLSTDAGATVNYYENYWPHIWKNSKKAAGWMARKLQKNPGFVKKRHFETIQDGLNAGLELKYTNPEEIVLAREISGIQHRMTLDFMADMKDQGLMKFSKIGRPLPEGWARVKGDVLKVFFPKVGSRGGVSLVLGGDWIMPKEAAKLVNNFLSPSLWSRQDFWGKLFRGSSQVKNAFVSTILGLSGFHFVETSVSSVATQMTLAAKEILRGNVTVGLAGMLRAPVEPALAMFGKGGIINAWRTGNASTPYEAQAVRLMERGGMRPEMTEQWQISVDNKWKEVYRRWIKGDKIAATFPVIPAIMQTISAPLMKVFVPRLKVHSYLRLSEDFIRTNPHLTERQQNIGLGKIADVVDNRFGQLVYDNLFINRTLRDIGVFSSLSMGWNLGTFREFGGAAFDAGRIALAKTTGRKVDIVDFLAGKNLGKLNATPDRILYTMFYTATFATIGSMLHYAMTGKAPDEVLDYFYPKTGRKNPDGSDERFQMPTMLKEVFNSKEALRKHGLVAGTLEYVNHKLNPLVSSTIDLIQNKNFWGAEIRDPNAPLVTQAEQIAEFMGEQALPISIKVYMRHKDIAGENSALPFLGFNIAKPSVARTPVQNEIYDLYTRSFPKVFTKIQAEKLQKRREVKELIFKGKYAEAKSKFLRLKRDKVITNRSWASYVREYSLPPDVRAFKALQVEQQKYLYGKMNLQERLKYGKYLKHGSGRGRSRSRSRSRRR